MFGVDFVKRMKRFINVYSSFTFPVLICDDEYNYFWSNHSARTFFTRKDGRINVKAMLAELDLSAVNDKLLTEGFYIAGDIIPFNDIQINIYPIFHPNNEEIEGILLIFLERSLSPTKSFSDYFSKTSDIFADNIREILNNIFVTSDIMASKADLLGMDWIIPHINLINVNVYEILRISHNITAYSKLQNQQVDLNFNMVDLNETLCILKDSISALAGVVGIPIEFNLPDEPVYIPLDNEWAAIAFYNILHNSLYYTKAGNEVKVSIEEDAHFVNLIIEDRGIGIKEEVLSSVFKPYHSALNSGKPCGIGLGLALSSRIIDLHDGQIKIESEESIGTKVTINLPTLRFSNPLPLNQQRKNGNDMSTLYRSTNDRFSELYIGLTSSLLSPYNPNKEFIDSAIKGYKEHNIEE